MLSEQSRSLRRSRQGHHHGDVPPGRADGIHAAAGAGRFLGALVRALQAAHPVLEKAVSAAGGKVKLVKMNIDEHPQIAGQLGIQSIPAVYRLQERPAGGRLHGRPAGKPDQGASSSASSGPLGPGAGRGDPGRGRGGARRRGRSSPARPSSIPQVLAARARKTCAALAALAKLHVERRRSARARKRFLAMAPAGQGGRSRHRRRRARRSSSPSRRARSAISPSCERRIEAEPRRSSGALRSRAGAERRAGEREEAADHLLEIVQARPQLERRRRAQAARAVLRGLGPDGRDDDRRAAASCPSLLFSLRPCERGAGMMAPAMGTMNAAAIEGRRTARPVIPVFPLPGALLLPRGADAAEHLRAALSGDGRRCAARRRA